jgi:hypothetical protein
MRTQTNLFGVLRRCVPAGPAGALAAAAGAVTITAGYVLITAGHVVVTS